MTTAAEAHRAKLAEQGYVTCPACKRFDYPVHGMWDSGQFGPQCSGCQNPLGQAVTPPVAAVVNEGQKMLAQPAEWSREQEPPEQRAPQRPAKRAPGRRPEAPLAKSGDGSRDELAILRGRLAEVLEESAELRVLVYRLRGLQSEERELRKEVARVEQARARESVGSHRARLEQLIGPLGDADVKIDVIKN